jgi:hypothetical protein
MIAKSGPRLIFQGGFDAREAAEARDRGFRSHVWVEFTTGERYPVVFYDIVRLHQDLQHEADERNPYVAEAGLIVIPEVTNEYMEKAVSCLANEGFFESLRPTTEHAETQSL